DRVSQPGNAPIIQDMVIKVSRVDTSKTAQATEDVPFDSVESDSADLFKGEQKVTQAGVAGSLVKTFKLVLVDGQEASREL
ncbi:G5 domain-containing protein, partial [Burkholderia sp. SIMBA_057]